MRRSTAVVVVVAVVGGAAGRAAADNGMVKMAEGLIAGTFVTELAIPDMRLVLGADGSRRRR